ncbi:class A beta-lactamase [Gluconacetobacter takamatsuzukensis]|uniref:Beta-lactamase n=1 Tax=Gluconacetobacter takamatsuzukensis TaxID=1286190 RepID=A0A7W4KEA7_9PROT|nr:class A beta-lactamase [Gluconacetobacter takamatsuzukensis]MBB2205245.1 class A beta-lactamase [Gluconacetobacter takamatsuzukensis]
MRRRDFLQAAPALLVSPAYAGAAGPIAAYERATGGNVGVFARNISSGKIFAWRQNERFVMCSTFKASLAACVLAHVDRGQADLDEVIGFAAADMGEMYAPVAKRNLGRGRLSVREMCAGAVEFSDNVCANKLLARIGGPAVLTRFWRALGDDVTRLDDIEPLLNRTPLGGVRNTTTPEAMAGIVRHLVLGDVLSDGSRAMLKDWMVNCQTGKNRLRAGLPDNWVVGDKTGNNGRDIAGDLAIAWPGGSGPMVMAVYTRGGVPTEAQFAALFAGIGRQVAATLG